MSEQKVVIVTGASTGIGKACAQRFANDGYAVVLNARTLSKLKASGDSIGDDKTKLIVAGNVSSEDDVKDLVAKTIENFGRIDVLVNNAGIAIGGAIEGFAFEDWNKQMAINAGGMFLLCKTVLPYLEKTKGTIINVSSVSGIGGDWGMFAYNASKGAVSNFTRALALDLGAKGIRVNAVAPSLTRTEMASGIFENDDLLDKFIERIPMARGAEPEEVADVIAFLASNDARFVNGVVLPVDGGLSASNGQPPLN